MTESEKSEAYFQLMMKYDKLDHKISQLKASNGGINISEETLKEINTLKNQQQTIINEAAALQTS
jgi:uncharacterized protein YdcH (DUF465 family)